MTHMMFDELTFDNDFEFNYNDDSHVDKYLMDLLYPSPKPMLLPEFDPYKVEPYNTTNYSCISNFFIFIGVLQFGMFFGFLATSIIYNYMGNWDIDNDIEFLDKEDVPYEKKYKLKKRDTSMDSDEFEDIIPSENTFIQEVTPDGMVFMNYNNDEEGFTYWSDNNIRFSYLETVARRFVNCFGCSHLYIERECNKEIYDSDYEVESHDGESHDGESDVTTIEEENEGGETQEEETQEEETQKGDTQEEENEDTSGPFVQFKKYNIRAGSGTGTSEDADKRQSDVNTSCKFIKKGKLSEFKITQDIQINEPKQKMTFASFKAMFINTDNSNN